MLHVVVVVGGGGGGGGGVFRCNHEWMWEVCSLLHPGTTRNMIFPNFLSHCYVFVYFDGNDFDQKVSQQVIWLWSRAESRYVYAQTKDFTAQTKPMPLTIDIKYEPSLNLTK